MQSSFDNVPRRQYPHRPGTWYRKRPSKVPIFDVVSRFLVVFAVSCLHFPKDLYQKCTWTADLGAEKSGASFSPTGLLACSCSCPWLTRSSPYNLALGSVSTFWTMLCAAPSELRSTADARVVIARVYQSWKSIFSAKRVRKIRVCSWGL